VWLNWAALIEAASPWVDYIVEQSTADSEQATQKAAIQSQIRIGTDVLKTVRSFTNETYFEDGVMVNHGLLEIRDVDK
jgi:hypothetical protein